MLLTLTSDIGQPDYLTGAVKGQLLKINPGFNLVDITHQLSPFNYVQAAYICRNTLQNFPANTCHIILVDLFNSKPKHLLLAYHKEQYIACADNGLLTMILETRPEKVVAIPMEEDAVKTTLYCAGIIGNVIDLIEHGRRIEDFGDTSFPLVEKKPIRPLISDNSIDAQIIFIDSFENVVLNITRELFEEQRRGRKFKIVFKRNEVIDQISDTYADVAEGEKLALFNSAGHLEIALNRGNAAGLFGLNSYSESSGAQAQYISNRMFYEVITIYFE
jgi:S-adenosyl-L-methionine hydrolase (adenosine-forming)